MKKGFGFLTLIAVCFAGFFAVAMAQNGLGWQVLLQKAGVLTDGKNWTWSNGVVCGQNLKVVDYVTTTTARTITAAESGAVFTVSESGDDPVTFNLPPCQPGLTFTFVDEDATAAADLTINPDDADKINLGTAGVSYNDTGDAIGEAVTIVGDPTGVNWILKSKSGTWAAGA